MIGRIEIEIGESLNNNRNDITHVTIWSGVGTIFRKQAGTLILPSRRDAEELRDLLEAGQRPVPVTVVVNSEPVEVRDISDTPMYSDNQLKDAVRKANRQLLDSLQLAVISRSARSVHEALCGCISADCRIRVRARELLGDS